MFVRARCACACAEKGSPCGLFGSSSRASSSKSRGRSAQAARAQEQSVYSYGNPTAFENSNPWKRAALDPAKAPLTLDYSKVIPTKQRVVSSAPSAAKNASSSSSSSNASSAQVAAGREESLWPMSSQAFEFGFTDEEIAASRDLKCAVCLDAVIGSSGDSILPRRFGILPNCTHVFCLDCIRGWRKSDIAEVSSTKEFARACPVCRTESGFIVPSRYFVSEKMRRYRLVATYKASLKRIPCKYFSSSGSCPFGSSCHYLHVLADGSQAPLLDRAKGIRWLLCALQRCAWAT